MRVVRSCRRSRRWRSWAPASLIFLVASCTSGDNSTPVTSRGAATGGGVVLSQSPSAQRTPRADVFVLTASRAQMIRTLVALIDAYNHAVLEDVLPLVTDNVVWTDCDYASASAVSIRGKLDLSKFLKGRFADHDQIEIGTIWNLNDDPATNAAIGLSISKRTSDTLTRLGFREGIVGAQAVKIPFVSDNRIGGFVAASLNQPQECRPSR